MEPFSVAELIRAVGGRVEGPVPDGLVRSISTDSRAIPPGACFFALRGERFDGHAFVETALNAGGCCAVVRDDAPAPPDGRIIRVADTLRALGDLARWYRRRMGFRVVGITGSAGKTTTRQIVHHVLSRRMGCHQAEKSFNNAVGLPLTLLRAGREHAVVVAELGTNAPGEIRDLTLIAEPDIAVVTNVLPAHLEGFGSLEAIVAEKASIAEGLRPDGCLLINGRIPELVAYCRRRGLAFETFGTSADCVIRADGLQTDGDRGRLTIESVRVEVPLAGRANLENVLAAWAVCRRFGVQAGDFAGAVASLTPPEMRLQLESIGPLLVLNDCYNANPASMANALDCLQRLAGRTGRRSVFICGTMAELGPAAESLHEDLGRQAADHGVRVLLAAGSFAEAVERGFRQAAGTGRAAHHFTTTGVLCDNLQEFVAADDIVLVKGSRCMHLEQAVRRLRAGFAPAEAGAPSARSSPRRSEA